MSKALNAAALAVLAAASSPAGALPPYQRLFRARYGFAPNCTLCHERDSWEPNGYGRRFLKTDRSLSAFGTIEDSDADEDGVDTAAEITARSNPGDPRSRPSRPGDWLGTIAPLEPPRKPFAAFFPQAGGAAVREETIATSTRSAIEARLGAPLRDEDLYPVLFVPRLPGESRGAALYGSTPGSDPVFFLAAYAQEARGAPWRVRGVRVLAGGGRALKSAAYVKQYAGRLPGELASSVKPPKPTLNQTSRALAEAIARGAVIAETLLTP